MVPALSEHGTTEGRSATMPAIKDTGTCREEDIRKRAYELFLARLQSGAPGDEQQDWYEAERQLKMQATRARARER